MTNASNEIVAGQEKPDWRRAIGNACFRFRAISVVPVILAVFFLFNPVDCGSFNPVLSILGSLLALTGAATRIVAVGFAKPFTSGRENYLKAENLNTTGLYSIVRNPLYIGNFLVYNGVLIAYSNPVALLLFNAFFIPNYYFIIYSEEKYLESQFGAPFSDYCRTVPRIMPNFPLYKKNGRPFSLAKVAFKEKDTTLYWIFFLAVALLLKQYKLNNGSIEHFWWHAIPVLAALAMDIWVRLTIRKNPV